MVMPLVGVRKELASRIYFQRSIQGMYLVMHGMNAAAQCDSDLLLGVTTVEQVKDLSQPRRQILHARCQWGQTPLLEQY